MGTFGWRWGFWWHGLRWAKFGAVKGYLKAKAVVPPGWIKTNF
jgi:hypothetical protein